MQMPDPQSSTKHTRLLCISYASYKVTPDAHVCPVSKQDWHDKAIVLAWRKCFVAGSELCIIAGRATSQVGRQSLASSRDGKGSARPPSPASWQASWQRCSCPCSCLSLQGESCLLGNASAKLITRWHACHLEGSACKAVLWIPKAAEIKT